MKLNFVLFFVLIMMLVGAYVLFEKDSDMELQKLRQQNYLLPIDSLERWSIEIPNGRLSFKNRQYFWESYQSPQALGKPIQPIKLTYTDDKLVEIFTRLRDLKVMATHRINENKDEAQSIKWNSSKSTGVIFNFMGESDYEIGPLNRLTGRMKILNIKTGVIYIIDDESTLKKPYKSFEIGQQIKYAKLLKVLRTTKWNQTNPLDRKQ